jgi:hypothetical protein
MDFNVSKYCVTITSCITSFADAPSTTFWNCSIETRSPSNDSLPLVRDSLSLPGLALGGHLFALRRVDVVHGRLHLGIGNNIGHKDIHNFVAEQRHIGTARRTLRPASFPEHAPGLPARHRIGSAPPSQTTCNRRRRPFPANPVLHRYGNRHENPQELPVARDDGHFGRAHVRRPNVMRLTVGGLWRTHSFVQRSHSCERVFPRIVDPSTISGARRRGRRLLLTTRSIRRLHESAGLRRIPGASVRYSAFS